MKILIRKHLLHKAGKQGQGMVEFAIVLPVLLMVIVGIFALGHLFFIHIMVSSAAREAVRYGMASGQTPSGVTRYLDCNGMRDAAVRIGGAVGVQNSTNVDITYDSGPGTSVKATCPTGGNFSSEPTINQGDRVVVNVTIQYVPNFPLVSLPSFPVSSMAARTIIKSISIGSAPPPYVPPEPPELCELEEPVTCEGYGLTFGSISRDVWLNIMGDQVSHLTSAPAYIADAPTFSDTLPSFDMAQSYPNANYYGTRIRGYICPPYDEDIDGNPISYTFYLASNNAAVLYLSSSQDPGAKSAIITINDWTYYQEWRSSGEINLTAGTPYYIEVLHKEDVELDNVSVAWSTPGFVTTVIDGEFLAPFGP